jgi:hypothetical protein
MVQSGSSPRLPLEAHTERAFDQGFREHLNGDIPLQSGVASLVDRAHPSAPEQAEDAVRPDLFTGEIGIGRLSDRSLAASEIAATRTSF